MMLRQVSALALVILSLSGAGTVMAAPKPFSSSTSETVAQQVPRRQGQLERGGERLLQQLNLTPEQTQQLEALRQRHEVETAPYRSQLQQIKQELQTLMRNNASEDQLRAKHREMQQLMQQMGEAQFSHQLEMRRVLTPEQQQLMMELMQEQRGQQEQRQERGQGQGRGRGQGQGQERGQGRGRGQREQQQSRQGNPSQQNQQQSGNGSFR